jgi:hypothetical protein
MLKLISKARDKSRSRSTSPAQSDGGRSKSPPRSRSAAEVQREAKPSKKLIKGQQGGEGTKSSKMREKENVLHGSKEARRTTEKARHDSASSAEVKSRRNSGERVKSENASQKGHDESEKRGRDTVPATPRSSRETPRDPVASSPRSSTNSSATESSPAGDPSNPQILVTHCGGNPCK